MINIEQSWLNHIPEFPFYMSVGVVSKFLVENKDDFLYYVYNNLNKDIYVSIYNLHDKNEENFNLIYLDIDNEENPSMSLIDLVKITEFLREIEVPFRVYFSGKKGFAVYIDFKKTHIPNFKDKLKNFVDDLIEVLDLMFLDRNVCIDIARISRLPYSKNTKSGRRCIPLPESTDFSKVTMEWVYSYSKVIQLKRSTLNEEFPSIIKEHEVRVTHVTLVTGKVDYIDEVEYLLKYAKNLIPGIRHHAVRLKIIPTLIKLGHDNNFIQKICRDYWLKSFKKEPSDNDKSWINAQIKLCRSKNITPIRLDNFRDRYGNKGIIGI